ncbi:MAG TPA: type II secretion system F family protein [Gaiellaceae bacterium]|nr:type II secretion system F family protein [Gaiellaceae bacterium]
MRRRAAVGAVLGCALMLLAPAAQAGVKLTGIDTSGYPSVRVSVVTSARTPRAPAVLENGSRVSLSSAQNLGRAKAVVLAVDRSQSMRGKPLADAVAAARRFVNAKGPGDRLAVATFATTPLMATGFSTARIDADSALRSIAVDAVQGTTLYDALVLSARRLENEALPGRVIIVVTDGNETRSEATLADAIAAANQAHAAVYVVAIESAKFTPEPLKKLAGSTGGTYYGAGSSAALAGVYASIAGELRRTWRLEYATAARAGEKPRVTVSALGSSAVGTFAAPGNAAPPKSDEPSRLLPDVFFETVLGTQLISLITALIVLLGASLALTTVKGARLRKKLAPHLAQGPEVRKRKLERERFAAAAGLFKVTESAFAHWRFWKRLEVLLERSDLPLRTVEFAYVIAGAALLGGLIGAFMALSSIWIIACLAGGGAVPIAFVWFKATRRTRAFENQLPDVLITLAAALKAGHSFKQGLQTIVDEGHPPASKEFQRVLTEARLGRPLNDALSDMADRLGSKNFEFVITAVTIQQQVGGSLAGLIDMVADTVRQRQQFIRKIKGLTAMGRAGAYVLIGLPFFIGAMITIINPTYMDPLFHTPTGHKLIYTGLAMMAFGSAVLKKIVSFKG